MTIAVEDYFQGRAFASLIDRRDWNRFESRVERNTLRALSLLDLHSARATFFFLNWTAERHPELVREVVRRGHEVASSGDGCSFRNSDRSDFARVAGHSREVLENAGGQRVHGYRVADHQIRPEDLWALEVLAQQGYTYDSSVSPYLWSFRSQPWRQFIHQQQFGNQPFWEIPLTSISAGGMQIPVAGGNWFRQLPEGLVKRAVRHWMEARQQPFVMYFRAWDLDADQPVITAASRVSRVRHYRHAGQATRLIQSFLSEYKFSSIAEHLGLKSEAVRSRRAAAATNVSRAEPVRTPATIVIPCFNEEATLPYLANTLRDLRSQMEHFDLRFVFVDDGSSDSTLDSLKSLFGSSKDCEVVSRTGNHGVASAILAGIRHAQTEIVCSMDCDCSYDPAELAAMIPLLAAGVDMVTASPYHPDGQVLHVPKWRLVLSRAASRLYRLALGKQLHTYTSCFRVYRRSAMLPVRLRENGFLGIAETICVLHSEGAKIAEYPTALRVRMLGHSKMQIVRTIRGHLRLLSRLLYSRILSHGNTRMGRAAEMRKGVMRIGRNEL